MKILFKTVLLKKLDHIKQTDINLYRKIQKQIYIFRTDISHPSLRNHKLQGNLHNTYSISITMSVRMLYFKEGETAVFFEIGTHDEVYRK